MCVYIYIYIYACVFDEKNRLCFLYVSGIIVNGFVNVYVMLLLLDLQLLRPQTWEFQGCFLGFRARW